MTDSPSTTALLSVAEAASYASVTTKTVRRYIAAGQLPAFRMGTRLIRVRRGDMDALMRPIPTVAQSGSAA